MRFGISPVGSPLALPCRRTGISCDIVRGSCNHCSLNWFGQLPPVLCPRNHLCWILPEGTCLALQSTVGSLSHFMASVLMWTVRSVSHCMATALLWTVRSLSHFMATTLVSCVNGGKFVPYHGYCSFVNGGKFVPFCVGPKQHWFIYFFSLFFLYFMCVCVCALGEGGRLAVVSVLSGLHCDYGSVLYSHLCVKVGKSYQYILCCICIALHCKLSSLPGYLTVK